MTVTVRSFAKINLGLRIGAAREDGFHELLTVYQTIGLHDVIRLSVSRGSGIEIRCKDPRVPRDESNTCWRVVERAREALGAKGRVVIEIEKNLPVQGGLGGASANAVAALLGLERAVSKPLARAERLAIAAEVGSDLPLFLIGGTVLGVGRGEQVYPLPELPVTACVVITPEIGVSTPKAFREWDRRQERKPASSADDTPQARSSTAARGDTALKHGPSTLPGDDVHRTLEKSAKRRSTGRKQTILPYTDVGSLPGSAIDAREDEKLTAAKVSDRMKKLSRGLSAWLSVTYSGAPSGFTRRGRAENPLLWLVRAGIENDFEEVVFPEYPKLCEAKGALLRAGAKYASLSGSGSVLYGLFRSRATAARAVVRLRKQGWAAQATTTVTRAAYWSKIFD